jgi:DNA recombination protein RmuC
VGSGQRLDIEEDEIKNISVDVIAYSLAGLVVGLGALVAYILKQRGTTSVRDSLEAENRLLKEDMERAKQVEYSLREELRQSDAERVEKATLNEELNKKLESQMAEQEKNAKQMQERFENLANKILDQKSAKFTESNKENIKSLLEPLDKDIRNFRKKVEDIHEKDLSQQASLKEFLGNLQQAQTQLSEDARNLTIALKGDSKKQGDWGEFILERTLEASGLIKGLEFSMQESFDRQRPDAIIRLPEDRAIVVDAKVSLTAYERSIGTDDEDLKKQALKEHLQSLKKHVDELSDKDYSAIEEINTPDFVLLFIPIEPAFGAALTLDPDLYQYAFDRKIVLVTSSTLMATIKTVANLWKLEKQNKHAHDIARRAGLLYDKFVGFLSSIDDIGKALGKATDAHDKAVSQLSTGPGNLVGQVEKLKAMGIRTKKELPQTFAKELEEPLPESEQTNLPLS